MKGFKRQRGKSCHLLLETLMRRKSLGVEFHKRSVKAVGVCGDYEVGGSSV